MKLPDHFDTCQLDKAMSDRSLQNEQERQQLLQRVIAWLDEHGLNYGMHTAYIFGSLTKPYKFHQNSDIDIAVEQINPEDLFAVMGWLSEAIERDVDIIELNKCHFSDRIRKEGIQWTATKSSHSFTEARR